MLHDNYFKAAQKTFEIISVLKPPVGGGGYITFKMLSQIYFCVVSLSVIVAKFEHFKRKELVN